MGLYGGKEISENIGGAGLMERGFKEVRTVRAFAGAILFVGILLVTFAKVMGFMQDLGQNAVNLGLARYSNFTGRFAARNFAEDRQLLHFLNLLNETLLPVAHVLVPLLLIVGLVVTGIGIFMWLYPQTGSQILIALKWLKLVPDPDVTESEVLAKDKTNVKSTLIFIGCLLIAVFFASFVFRSCTNDTGDTPKKVEEISQEASHYIELQKKYFAENNALGSSQMIGYVPSSSDYFEFKSQGIGFWRAVNKEKWEECPAGNKWRVQMKLEGLFEKNLKIFISSPSDSLCAKLTPDFRKVKHLRKEEKK